jgi:hypothetical protein
VESEIETEQKIAQLMLFERVMAKKKNIYIATGCVETQLRIVAR